MIRTREERLELFEANRLLAEKLTWQMHARLPQRITYEEIQNAALWGLWLATERWLAEKSLFTTLAWICMRNEVVTWLRSSGNKRSVPAVRLEEPAAERVADRPHLWSEPDERLELAKMLGCLEPREREFCLACWVDEETAATVATRYRLSRSSVTNCLTESRKVLRRELREFAPVHQTHGGGNNHVDSDAGTREIHPCVSAQRPDRPCGSLQYRPGTCASDDRRAG